jgi:hypothetical protein
MGRGSTGIASRVGLRAAAHLPLMRLTFQSNDRVVRIQSHGTLRGTARSTRPSAQRSSLAPRYNSVRVLRVGRGAGERGNPLLQTESSLICSRQAPQIEDSGGWETVGGPREDEPLTPALSPCVAYFKWTLHGAREDLGRMKPLTPALSPCVAYIRSTLHGAREDLGRMKPLTPALSSCGAYFRWTLHGAREDLGRMKPLTPGPLPMRRIHQIDFAWGEGGLGSRRGSGCARRPTCRSRGSRLNRKTELSAFVRSSGRRGQKIKGLVETSKFQEKQLELAVVN